MFNWHLSEEQVLGYRNHSAVLISDKDSEGLNSSVVQHIPNEDIKWRLTKPSDGSDELEEIVLRIQGILCEKELPLVKFAHR
jgi:hypothetical protein